MLANKSHRIAVLQQALQNSLRVFMNKQISLSLWLHSEEAKKLAQARLHRAGRWQQARAGRDPGVRAAAAGQDLRQVRE